MINGEIDREYQVDPTTVRLDRRAFVGKTFDGRDVELVTSASVVLCAELYERCFRDDQQNRGVLNTTQIAEWIDDVGPDKVRSAIDCMRGKIGILPAGYEYVLGPIYGTVLPDEIDYYEIRGDWGIYKVKRFLAK